MSRRSRLLVRRQSAQAILARETTSFPGRLGIQHRDVLQAIATGKVDVGIIVHPSRALFCRDLSA
jgi:predicted solute-binding protein